MLIFYKILFAILIILAFCFILLTICLHTEKSEETKYSLLIAIILICLSSFLPSKIVSYELIEVLPHYGSVKFELKDEENFIDNNSHQIRNLILKYVTCRNLSIQIECCGENYYICVVNENGDIIEHSSVINKFFMYFLIKDFNIIKT